MVKVSKIINYILFIIMSEILIKLLERLSSQAKGIIQITLIVL